MLLEPELRARLERLSLANRRRVRGVWAGRHRSLRLGESLDFADYREYHPGDDFRRIDYNLWARLGVVLVRLFEAEDELPIRILVDNSKSMDFGLKLDVAKRLAGAVAYLALAGGERVELATVPDPGRPATIGPRGRHLSAWPRLELWLENLTPAGGTDLAAAARTVAAAASHRGPVVVVSDLLTDTWRTGIDVIGAVGGGVVLHVLADEELDPDLTGDLTLRDRETGRELAVSMSGAAIARYRERVERFLADVANRSRRVGMDYVLARADADAVDVALRELITVGALR